MTLNVMEAPKCSPKKINSLKEGEKLLLTCSVEASGGGVGGGGAGSGVGGSAEGGGDGSLPDVFWIKDGDPE